MSLRDKNLSWLPAQFNPNNWFSGSKDGEKSSKDAVTDALVATNAVAELGGITGEAYQLVTGPMLYKGLNERDSKKARHILGMRLEEAAAYSPAVADYLDHLHNRVSHGMGSSLVQLSGGLGGKAAAGMLATVICPEAELAVWGMGFLGTTIGSLGSNAVYEVLSGEKPEVAIKILGELRKQQGHNNELLKHGKNIPDEDKILPEAVMTLLVANLPKDARDELMPKLERAIKESKKNPDGKQLLLSLMDDPYLNDAICASTGMPPDPDGKNVVRQYTDLINSGRLDVANLLINDPDAIDRALGKGRDMPQSSRFEYAPVEDMPPSSNLPRDLGAAKVLNDSGDPVTGNLARPQQFKDTFGLS